MHALVRCALGTMVQPWLLPALTPGTYSERPPYSLKPPTVRHPATGALTVTERSRLPPERLRHGTAPRLWGHNFFNVHHRGNIGVVGMSFMTASAMVLEGGFQAIQVLQEDVSKRRVGCRASSRPADALGSFCAHNTRRQ